MDDKRLKLAKEALESGSYDKETIEYIFPELKEENSEDKRIRNNTINIIHNAMDGIVIPLPLSIYKESIDWLEKQGEQKLANNAVPRFKVGDWIVCKNLYPAHIVNITDNKYEIEFTDNGAKGFHPIDLIDRHFWTIRDAKDGDVLVASDGSIFLFAGVIDCACKYYCALTTDNEVKINKEIEGGYWETSRAVHPATKEQHDILFQKMKEAGYEWDSEKKELIKENIS